MERTAPRPAYPEGRAQAATAAPRTITVFISSPSDVTNCAALVEEVARELQPVFAGVGLNVATWHYARNAHPDHGTDPQSVVNDQAPEYDIYVGILCERLGTPTPRAPSGTAEELRAASERQARTGLPYVLLYFCERLSSIDRSTASEQQRGVLDLLDKYQGLACAYRDGDDLRELLRMHLSQVLVKLLPRVAPEEQAERNGAPADGPHGPPPPAVNVVAQGGNAVGIGIISGSGWQVNVSPSKWK